MIKEMITYNAGSKLIDQLDSAPSLQLAEELFDRPGGMSARRRREMRTAKRDNNRCVWSILLGPHNPAA
jgi:hypothetical protein